LYTSLDEERDCRHHDALDYDQGHYARDPAHPQVPIDGDGGVTEGRVVVDDQVRHVGELDAATAGAATPAECWRDVSATTLAPRAFAASATSTGTGLRPEFETTKNTSPASTGSVLTMSSPRPG